MVSGLTAEKGGEFKVDSQAEARTPRQGMAWDTACPMTGADHDRKNPTFSRRGLNDLLWTPEIDLTVAARGSVLSNTNPANDPGFRVG